MAFEKTIRVVNACSGKCESCHKKTQVVNYDHETIFGDGQAMHSGEHTNCEKCLTQFYKQAIRLLHPEKIAQSVPATQVVPSIEGDDYSHVDWTKRPRPTAIGDD